MNLFAGKKFLPYCRLDGVGCVDSGEQVVNDCVLLCGNGFRLVIESVAD